MGLSSFNLGLLFPYCLPHVIIFLHQTLILGPLIVHESTEWILPSILECFIDKGRVHSNNETGDCHTLQDSLLPNTTILELQHENEDGLD
jgi:hypothetical protein